MRGNKEQKYRKKKKEEEKKNKVVDSITVLFPLSSELCEWQQGRAGEGQGKSAIRSNKIIVALFFFYYIVSKLINNLFKFTAIPAQALTNTGLEWPSCHCLSHA